MPTFPGELPAKISLNARCVFSSIDFSEEIACIERRLDHSQFHPPSFTDHVLVPRRIPNQLHISFIDAVDRQDFALRVVGDGWTHSATRRGQSHFHFYPRAAIIFLEQSTI